MKKKFLLLETIILASIGGFINAYSFFMHGGKYALLQTGTIISMINDIINGNSYAIILGLIVFFSFYLGIVFTYMWSYFLKKRNKEKLLNISILIFDCLLLIPNLFFEKTNKIDLSIIAIVGMGIIGGTLISCFKNLLVNFVSTMMTNNTKLLTESILDCIVKKNKNVKKILIYLGIILGFIMGAAVFMLIDHFTIYEKYSIVIPLTEFIVLIIVEHRYYSIEKNLDLKKFPKYVEYNKLNYDEELVNKIVNLDLSEINKLDLKKEYFDAVISLKNNDICLIKQNSIALRLYCIKKIKENDLEILKNILE